MTQLKLYVLNNISKYDKRVYDQIKSAICFCVQVKEEVQLGPAELVFLLEDMWRKLDFSLAAAPAKKAPFLKVSKYTHRSSVSTLLHSREILHLPYSITYP